MMDVQLSIQRNGELTESPALPSAYLQAPALLATSLAFTLLALGSPPRLLPLDFDLNFFFPVFSFLSPPLPSLNACHARTSGWL